MTSVQITRRDQMHDKVYQFVVLTAGMARMRVSDLLIDDAIRPNGLIREKAIQKYDKYITEHENLLRSRENAQAIDKVGVEDIEQIKQDLALVYHKRAEELEKRTEVRPVCSIHGDCPKAPCCTNNGGESRALYFSNEIYFTPAFQAAVLMAHEKLKTRCKHVTLDTLMTDEEYNVMFARLVTIQLLIAIANHTKGQPNRIIEYRRLVLQEKSVVATITRKCRVAGQSSTMFEDDMVARYYSHLDVLFT